MAKKKAAAPEGDGGDVPKGGKRKLIVIVAAVLVLAGGGGYWKFGRGGSQNGAHSEEKKDGVAFVDMQEMTVNLASEPNQSVDRPRFLKFKVKLEIKEPKVAAAVQPLLPRVEDIFQVFVRELRASDLEGSGGVWRLREELLRRVNIAVAPSRVDAVLFNELIVQ